MILRYKLCIFWSSAYTFAFRANEKIILLSRSTAKIRRLQIKCHLQNIGENKMKTNPWEHHV